MLGQGLHFNRSSRNGEDRFSSGARAQSEPLPEKSNAEIPASEPSPLCNLERFLESVTPSLPAQYVSKMKARSWRTCNGVESMPFFVLSDLWESFKEWSAYGAGVPLVLNDRDGVVQYYVPYLSGIQLYADLSKSTTKIRRRGEESDGEYFRDSSSDGSSDSEQERCGLSYSREQPSYYKSSNSPLTVDQMAVREQQRAFQEGFSSDEGEPEISQGCLLFEYLEHAPPYSREPLATKISDLALHCPELKTLRSCDLLPSSWISVAWYPIYRIPTGPTLRDLDACFLTFHSLHTPMTGTEVVHPPVVTYPSDGDGAPQVSLPVFGLASYKYKASLWTPYTGHQWQLENSLLQAADNWLNLLQVNHPDFSFCRR
ncbi:uncharacterized protein LOC121755629 isoform X1 [Salvia splendens]|uniref:uncharacterized protein LOC121755629 isoform X1 n=2 Tax=Salvia splendens TaxID=180675 RepID=UPI001C27CFE7|nr:uncharacterized protein LOC121755629 isoform X1 [Salvia splendens]XP_042006884.1 uncharacterized protein LOC121755629 isoform X1 [Salvia splendens]